MAKRGAAPKPQIVGVVADELFDEDEILERATESWRKLLRDVARKQNQRIHFERGPVCLVFAADLHLGSNGVDYERVYREAEIVAKTPGMYLAVIGDMLDNFILPKLVQARHKSVVTVEEEWVLVRKYLRIVKDKLLISVSGNHESWSWVLIGVDYFRQALAESAKNVIYDTDDAFVNVEVGKMTFPLRVRHLWKGTSMYNATHGIESLARLEHNFAIGVGAHTHACGVARQFNNGGQTGPAILCGSYKAHDSFARQKGFAVPNGSTAVAAILDESGATMTTNRLEQAAKYMEVMYK